MPKTAALAELKQTFRSRVARGAAVLALVILAAGIWARFTGLEWHFTTVDDRGVAEIIFRNRAAGGPELFPIPSFYTYAPLQFVFTPLLISEKQPYRTLLWRGRFPSAAAGCLALAACTILYCLIDRRRLHRVLVPLAMLSFSWENIIYAKQMHNYAIGVTGVMALLILLWLNLERPRFSLFRMTLNAFALAVISHMQYQLLGMVPVFYLVLFIAGWTEKADRKKLVLNFLFSGALYGALVFPMWFFFLRKHMAANAGAPPWAYGPHEEFLFHPDPSLNPAAKLKYALSFFIRNFYIVFQADTAFVPEEHPLLEPATFVLLILFVLGLIGFVSEKEQKKKLFGLYVCLVLASWFGLVFLDKLTLGPTRHALVYLPFLAVTAEEGLSELFERMRWKEPAGTLAAMGISGLMLVFFLLNYGVFLQERRDPVDEARILKILEKYNVDAIGTNVRTDGLSLMPEIEKFKKKMKRERSGRNLTMAWISRWDVSFGSQNCEEMRAYYNQMQLESSRQAGTMPALIDHPCSDYKVIYSERHPSNLQVDYSRRTQINIYTNSFYFYVVSRDPETIRKAAAA